MEPLTTEQQQLRGARQAEARAQELALTPAMRALARSFTPKQFRLFLRSLPQDSQRPGDAVGSRPVQGAVAQRLHPFNPRPNCLERSVMYAAFQYARNPAHARRLEIAWLDGDKGDHVIPGVRTERGFVGISLDPVKRMAEAGRKLMAAAVKPPMEGADASPLAPLLAGGRIAAMAGLPWYVPLATMYAQALAETPVAVES